MSLALFDMDGTLVDGDTNDMAAAFLTQMGVVDAGFAAPLPEYHRRFYAGTLSIEDFIAYIVTPFVGMPGPRRRALLHDMVQQAVLPNVKPGARRALSFHAARGDTAVIVTSTVDYLVQEFGAALGVAHVVAAPMELEDDVITGRLAGTVPYQQGKVAAIHAYLKAHGLDGLPCGYAYGDSVNDLPMMQLAAQAVAVDPDALMRERSAALGITATSWRTQS